MARQNNNLHPVSERTMPSEINSTANATDGLRQQVAEGLLYAHSRLNANTGKTLETAAFAYALIELLAERGLLTIEELDERKRIVGERLAQSYRENGMGAIVQDPEYDKYTFANGAEIDCASRIGLCMAGCCRLPFALSHQDIREGIVRWELGQPYLIEQGAGGYCTHVDRGGCRCTIYAQRPVPCRGYDCRQDARIWVDFGAGVPNPAMARPDWPSCLAAETEEGARAS